VFLSGTQAGPAPPAIPGQTPAIMMLFEIKLI